MIAPSPDRTVALVLSGGVALGAYEAGAYAALDAAGLRPDRVAGVSIGAVNAALIAGNPPERRVERLRAFWESVVSDPAPVLSPWGGQPTRGRVREGYNIAGVLQTFLFGRPGMFRPRPLPSAEGRPGLYDLAPLRPRLERMLDFGRLNNGDVRVSIAATDVVSGERVVFRGGVGGGIGPDHVLASCGQIPVYAPTEVEGRLLGDGCFSGNLPVDLVLDEPVPDEGPDEGPGELLCFAVDLFARAGSRPRTLGAAGARALDLAFGNQSHAILDGRRREGALRAALAAVAEKLPPGLREDPTLAPLLARGSARAATVFLLGYRAGLDEAGPGKGFDYTTATLSDRWAGGEAHAWAALRVLDALPAEARPPGVTVHEVAP